MNLGGTFYMQLLFDCWLNRGFCGILFNRRTIIISDWGTSTPFDFVNYMYFGTGLRILSGLLKQINMIELSYKRLIIDKIYETI